jgi:hypothetical protein
MVLSGRRAGKTALALLALKQDAEKVKGDYLYVAPSQRMCRIAWDLANDIFSFVETFSNAPNPEWRKLFAWRTTTCSNGSRIFFLPPSQAMEAFDSPADLYGVAVDEFTSAGCYDAIDPLVWAVLLLGRPALLVGTRARGMAVGDVISMWKRVSFNADCPPERRVFSFHSFTTWQGGLVSPLTIRDWYMSMSPEVREYELGWIV